MKTVECRANAIAELGRKGMEWTGIEKSESAYRLLELHLVDLNAVVAAAERRVEHKPVALLDLFALTSHHVTCTN